MTGVQTCALPILGGVKHTYMLDGTKVLKEVWGSNTLIPLYDNEDSVCGIVYNGEPYYFVKNLQGDVIAIVDEDVETVAKYSYDAWGVPEVKSDTSEIGIATINPYRYRGYYYDNEIGMYYLQSRYYNPVVGRFVNADDVKIILSVQTILAYNGLCYCDNCCVNGADFSGYSFTGDFWNYVNSLPIVAGIRNLAGFSWDSRQGIWYSQMYPIQRNFGYCDLYDSLAPLALIFIEHEKMPFKYGGKDWMVWLWKGQYGITIGAEIGLYVYSPNSWVQRSIGQKWYRCAYDSERIKMSFTLYKNGCKMFSRPYQTHWWLTGFKPGVKWWWEKLKMNITLGFHSVAMARAFCAKNGLRRPNSSKVSFCW